MKTALLFVLISCQSFASLTDKRLKLCSGLSRDVGINLKSTKEQRKLLSDMVYEECIRREVAAGLERYKKSARDRK